MCVSASNGGLPLIAGHRLVMVMVAIVKRPIVVKVEVPAHSVVLPICFKVIFGEFGIVRGAILLAIAQTATASITVAIVEHRQLASLR